MGLATGFTAARMKAIEDSSVTGGFVDVNGRLLLTRRDGGQIDGGPLATITGISVSNLPVGGTPTASLGGTPSQRTIALGLPNAYYPVGPFAGGTQFYHRIATLNGGSGTGGAHLQFLLSGLGNYGTARRGTVLVHVAQRGDSVISLRAWGFGMEDASQPITLFTKQISAFVFEVWGLFAQYVMNEGMTVLAMQGATLNLDSSTATLPTGLVAQTIEKIVSDKTTQNRMSGTTATRDAFFGVPSTTADKTALYNLNPHWYNTSKGWSEGYNGTAWVPRGGLVPIRPTGGAGGTIGNDNAFYFNSGGAVRIDGVFTSEFDDYKIVMDIDSNVAADTYFRWTIGTVWQADALYAIRGLQVTGASNAAYKEVVGGTSMQIDNAGASGITGGNITMEVGRPADPSKPIYGTLQGTTYNALSNGWWMQHGFTYQRFVAVDGFSIWPATAGTISGAIRVYGYGRMG